jgi:hypothetical protein
MPDMMLLVLSHQLGEQCCAMPIDVCYVLHRACSVIFSSLALCMR